MTEREPEPSHADPDIIVTREELGSSWDALFAVSVVLALAIALGLKVAG